MGCHEERVGQLCGGRWGRLLCHPQQSPPLLFVDNECAIGLATSSVRPKKSKSIDMRLDRLKERASQQFFRFVFLPGLINPADFFQGWLG